MSKMVRKMSWKKFRDSGALWLVNSFLHVFGMVIVIVLDDKDKITDVYPARCKFRGFSYEESDDGYKKITEYMAKNAESLLEDV